MFDQIFFFDFCVSINLNVKISINKFSYWDFN
uniref:Uncharacterized protein n=1 Tax=virus sp. ctiha2 TaxID=2827299 RepID=A0A8S5RHE7_9VIRU|nr:MAG TPA: hypothetical protein [virus sp. ctiha2]DAE86348.1 MAG TPA: hypothetical protein [Caudoviricetes sp.]DAE89672.1 MAG TPA: hypothetical protein [Bacteriophage sp.]DAT49002.1 MAG TPA: hypothetical protein [Caudoviricetes sp.]DAX97739.1 MAG TPA: hypothetical protein [Caudoviricetes sp.]